MAVLAALLLSAWLPNYLREQAQVPRMEHERAVAAADSAAKAVAEKPDDRALATRSAAALEAVKKTKAALDKAQPPSLLPAWALALAALSSLLAVIAYGLDRQPLGFLVDERGRMSLSRLQLVAWSVLILSGYWTVSAWNIGIAHAGLAATGDQVLPTMSRDLWLLLGIVFASPLASSLILKSKTEQGPAKQDGQSDKPGPTYVESQEVTNIGPVDARTTQRAWSFMDLFVGEYTGNRTAVDVSRLQQFIFTLLALIAYAVLLWQMLEVRKSSTMLPSMPDLQENAVALLGLSHAAYLAAKGIQK